MHPNVGENIYALLTLQENISTSFLDVSNQMYILEPETENLLLALLRYLCLFHINLRNSLISRNCTFQSFIIFSKRDVNFYDGKRAYCGKPNLLQ